jgi:hypothetical protein
VKLHLAVLLAAAAIAAAASHSPDAASERGASTRFAAFAPQIRSAVLSSAGAQRLAAASWWGGPHTASTGETVVVYLSESYPRDTALGQRWADFFAGLIHDDELRSMQAYVAPLAEVQEICGPRTLGCYGGGRVLTIGEPAHGVTAEAVAAHEYGHHVASTRSNPPWRADSWGPKRWASQANICARAAGGTAFPGDEGARYELNPGEGFAEVYRVLNETRKGATSFEWPVVDPSFLPDAPALEAAEADVVHPWTQPSTTTYAGRFAGRRRSWSLRIATPLDGELQATLRLRGGAGHEVILLAADGRTVLARGLWSASGQKTVEHTICGQRAVVVRVVRHGSAGPFDIRIGKP